MNERDIGQLASVILAQERAQMRRTLTAAGERLKEPPSGTALHEDYSYIDTEFLEVAEQLRGVMAKGFEDVLHLFQSMDEYAAAVRLVIGGEAMLPGPIASMVRSIHETALLVGGTYDASLTPAARFARIAALQIATAQGGREALQSFPVDHGDELARVSAAVAGIVGYLEDAGFVPQRAKHDPLRIEAVSWAGVKQSLRDNATAASLQYTPEIHFNWVVGSGATHSRLWYTAGLDGPWNTAVVALISPVLDLSHFLNDVLWGYTGVPVHHAHRSTHFRRAALYRRIRQDGDELGTYEHYRERTSELRRSHGGGNSRH